MRNGGRRERLGGNLDLQKAGKFEPAGELNLNDPLAARIAKQIRTKTPTIVFVPSGGGRRLMARPKIHYFPFVAREYLSDLAIRPLNLEERGLFIEYLCWMWESPVRGALFKAVPVSPEFRRGFAPVSPEFRLHNIVVPLLASKTSPEADFERAKQMEQKLIETSLIRVGLGGVLYNRRLLFYTTEYELKLLSQNKFPEFKERILSVVNDFTDVSPEFRRYFAEVSPPKRPISINKAKENLKLKQRGGDKAPPPPGFNLRVGEIQRSEEHTSELQSPTN